MVYVLLYISKTTLHDSRTFVMPRMLYFRPRAEHSVRQFHSMALYWFFNTRADSQVLWRRGSASALKPDDPWIETPG